MCGPFDQAFEWIREAEGEDSNPPEDPGGRTRFGISQAAHPDVDVPHLTLEHAREIYLEEYWTPVRGDELPAAIALATFDAAVQHDPQDAVRMLQRALGRLKIDGKLGPKTLAAVTRAGARRQTLLLVLCRLLAIRAGYYADLVALTPKLERFHHGWLVRLFRLHERVLSLP